MSIGPQSTLAHRENVRYARSSPALNFSGQKSSIFAPSGVFSRQNIHKSLVSGGYEGGKHGDLKILQVFNKYKA